MLDIIKTPAIGLQIAGPPGVSPQPLGSHYQYGSDRHELIRIIAGIKPEHRAAIREGVAEFALVLEGPLLVFCSRFGEALPWSGSAYHWHRLAREERTWPSVEAAGSGMTLEVSLIQASDGRVSAARLVTLPAPFARALHEAILEQARFSYDPWAERRALEGLNRRCPTTSALVAYSTVRAVVPA